MPDTKVTILKRDGTQSSYYATYSLARAAAVSGDVIQVWADLPEKILLKDGVDLWIAPGVVLNRAAAGATILDNETGYTVPVTCNIYGTGILKNTNTSSSATVCSLVNTGSKISIECDYIENLGSSQACINSSAAKLHLNCNKVFGRNHGAIFLNNNSADINLVINNVETGLETNTNTGTTAIISRGNGFIKINEIFCRNVGHCLSHRGGEITAKIKKMTTVNNRSGNISTVHLNQGSSSQKLILYFDEINNIAGTNPSLCAIEVGQGNGIFIGRKVYSEILSSTEGATIQIGGVSTQGFVKINEIVSKNSTALVLNQFTSEITIISNYVEGNRSDDAGVIFSFESATFIIKNATLRNLSSSSSAKGLGLFKNTGNGLTPNVTFNNVKIVSNGAIIFYNRPSPEQIDIKNYELFGNKDIENNINLKIGNSSNFVFVHSSNLTF